MGNSYLTEIEHLLEKYITPEWIELKSEKFKKINGYDDLEDKVIIRNFDVDRTLNNDEPFIYNKYIDKKTGKKSTSVSENIVKEESFEIESTIITLSDYCWFSEEDKDPWVSIGYNNRKRFYDLEELIDEIVRIIRLEIINCDRLASYNIIEKGILHIQPFFLSISEQEKFKAKKELILDLNSKTINYIKLKFNKFYKNYVNSISFDTLNFNLNRNQLICLIHLLDKADFFDPPGKQSKFRESKYYYFEKYFKCTDSKTDEKKLLTGISDEISKIKKNERSDGLHEVFNLIKNTYKNLTD